MNLYVLQTILVQRDVIEFLKGWFELVVLALLGKMDAFTGGIVLLITLFFCLYICVVTAFLLLTVPIAVILLVRVVKLFKQKRMAGSLWLFCCLAVFLVGWAVWSGVLTAQRLQEYDKLIEIVLVFLTTPAFSTAAILPCTLLCAYLAFPSAKVKEIEDQKPRVKVPALVGLGLLVIILLAELVLLTVCPMPVPGMEILMVLVGNFAVFTIVVVVFAIVGIVMLIRKLISKIRTAKKVSQP